MPVPKPRPPAPKGQRKARGEKGATDATDTRSTRSTRSAAQDTPPKREAQTPPQSEQQPPQPPRQPKPRAGTLEARLAEFLGVASFPFAIAGDQYSSQIIALRSPALATALADLAKENAAIKRVLERLLEGSAWGAVAMASLSIIVPICQAHGLIPGNDPFAAILPSPAPPKPMAWGQPQQSPNGGSAMGAPAPGSEGNPTDPAPEDDFRPTMPGAPPGVVTVAATGAAHPGT